MGITLDEIRRVATLARLEFTTTEELALIEHFDKILLYMKKIDSLDTAKVEPTAHAVTVASPLREDRVTNQPNTEALLANAPAREDHFFKVPKILE
jgi:aspartyl-tRNA(Asn)/glutamyl-tRNA(Gln) amidotransferase subunit C